MKHYGGNSYNDVLNIPTGDRRYFLGLLLKEKEREQEHYEKMRENSSKSDGKGKKTRRVGGDSLKSQIKSGNLPLS